MPKKKIRKKTLEQTTKEVHNRLAKPENVDEAKWKSYIDKIAKELQDDLEEENRRNYRRQHGY